MRCSRHGTRGSLFSSDGVDGQARCSGRCDMSSSAPRLMERYVMKSSAESALPPPGGAIAAGVSDVECDEARAGGGATRSRAPCSRGFRTAGPRKPVLAQPAVQTPALIAVRPSERTIRANMPLDYSSPTFVRAHPGRPGHRRTHSCPLSPAAFAPRVHLSPAAHSGNAPPAKRSPTIAHAGARCSPNGVCSARAVSCHS